MTGAVTPRDLDSLVAAVRAGTGDIVVVLAADLDALATATMRAAIAPLAIEAAPGRRVNAVAPGADSDAADVEATIVFLAEATSTTGQILDIS